MKLIIDIPEEVVSAIKFYGLGRIVNSKFRIVDRALQHGIPLNTIRAEIEAIDVTMGIKDYPFIPKAKVLNVIDKYKGE